MANNSILIVDDDADIREGLTHEVEKEFKGKVTVLNCKNGALAAEILKTNTIDIVVTDIKMPVMNGIELLHFIKNNHLSCKSVVLSSYDDFNLVRSAMTQGAVDYLLKPVDFPALNHLLYKLLAQVMLANNRQGNLPPVFNMWKLLEDYLQQSSHKPSDMLAFEEQYGLTDMSPCVLGCVRLQSASSEKNFRLQEMFREDLYNCLNKSWISYRTILTGEVASCFVFLIFPETDSSICLNALDSYRNDLVQAGYTVKINGEDYTLKDIPEAFQQYLSSFDMDYYDLPCGTDLKIFQPEEKQETLHKVVHFLSIYDMKMTLYFLTRYFTIVNRQKPPVKETKKELNDMIYELIRANPKYIDPLSNSKFTEHDLFHHIESLPSLSMLQKSFFESLSHMMEMVINNLPDRENHVIEQSKMYIEENYNDHITLEDVAAHVYMNKSYFSNFFKNRMGMNFRDYLRNYRIEKSIHFLTHTDMKIYEIAQAVGYSDSSHFIRAFKVVTGKKPEEYMNTTEKK